MTDLHTALKTAEEGSASGGGVNFVAIRLVSGKDSSILSLHAAPMSFSTAGVQRTDLLAELGFVRSRCLFITGGECYAISVDEDFDVSEFSSTFADAYEAYRVADHQLGRCGFRLNQPEGFAFFFGRRSQPSGISRAGGGDGHTASKVELLKQSSDASFDFAFTWVDSPAHKGWTTHYRPKHPPLSTETSAAFQYLGLLEFATCPEFDFEHCHWKFDAFTGDRPFLANEVHGLFDAHFEAFSQGIAELLRVQSLVRPFGLGFLASVDQVQPLPTEVLPQPSTKVEAKKQGAKPSESYEYDVALSFAGTERQFAGELAQAIADQGYKVFYDDFYPEHLWGKDLPVFFDDVYRKKSRFCIIFVSQEYASRMWTTHERRSAQARALEERGREYVLPIRVDETDLPGMPPTIGYVSLHDHSIDQIAGMLVAKLGSA